MSFEWDINKNKQNIKIHDVSFEEAIEAFYDPNAVEEFDLDHSSEETRFYLIGFSSRRLLFVVYAEKDADEVIRIISARKAEAKYQKEYETENYGKE